MSKADSSLIPLVSAYTYEAVNTITDPPDLVGYYSPFPFKVTWDITHKCNLRCQHCFVIFQDHKETNTIERSRHFLIAESIVSARPFLVSIAGGEPFVVPHLLEIIEYFIRNDIRVIIATNGTIDNPELMNAIALSDRITLQVSLDGGSAREHDNIRGAGSFDKTISFIERYSANIKIIVAITLTESVCNTLDNMLDLVSKCGCTAVKLQHFIITPSVPNAGLAATSASLSVANTAIRERVRTSTSLLILHPFDDGLESLPHTHAAKSCGIGLRECTITPNGNIALCGAVLDQCNLHGNVIATPLSELWREFITERPTVSGRPGACLCTG